MKLSHSDRRLQRLTGQWRQLVFLLPALLLSLSACRYVDSLLGREPDVADLPPAGFCTDTTDACVESEVTPPPLPTSTPLVAAGPALPFPRPTTAAASPAPTNTPTVTAAGTGIVPTPSPTSFATAPAVTTAPATAIAPATTIAPATATVPAVNTTPATATATPNAQTPAISYFRADVPQADPGQTITLSWAATQAITVTLWRMAPTGQFGEFWDVPLAGEFAYTIAGSERNSISFALVAMATAGNYVMETLYLPLSCPFTWFFTAAPDICPAAAPLVSAAAEQPFEHGLMIWVEAEDTVYVLVAAPGSVPNWRRYNDEWQEGDAPDDPALLPPPGYYQPQRGFGLVWREETGVREQLGWATAPEVGFTTIVQRTSYPKYNHTYIQAAGGGVWHLQPEGSRWGKE